jgi:hypothetical protein
MGRVLQIGRFPTKVVSVCAWRRHTRQGFIQMIDSRCLDAMDVRGERRRTGSPLPEEEGR